MNVTESPDLVRRRGRWITNKVMEIYVQEVSAMMYLPRLEQGQHENIFAWANSFQAAFQFAKWSVDLHLSPSLRHILLQHGSTMLESSGDFSHAREFGVEGRSSCTAAASLLTCDLHFKVQKGSCESLCSKDECGSSRRLKLHPRANPRPAAAVVQLQLRCSLVTSTSRCKRDPASPCIVTYWRVQ